MRSQTAEAASKLQGEISNLNGCKAFIDLLELLVEGFTVGILIDEQKFITSVTKDGLVIKELEQDIGKRLEHVVADPVSVGIVDGLEPVDIPHRDADILTDIIGNMLVQGIAVLQSGDAVVIRDDLERIVQQIRLVLLRDIVDGQAIVQDRTRRGNQRKHHIIIRIDQPRDEAEIQDQIIQDIRAEDRRGGKDRMQLDEKHRHQLDRIEGQ